MDKKTILDYVTETPGNTNRAVLESMLDSIDEGGNAQSVEEVLIFDGEVNSITLSISNEQFITNPFLSTDDDLKGITFAIILKYTDVIGNFIEYKRICMLKGSVTSSLAGNTAEYNTNNMPYNKPNFLMETTSTSNNTMQSINFNDGIYMVDTSQPIHAVIYRLK